MDKHSEFFYILPIAVQANTILYRTCTAEVEFSRYFRPFFKQLNTR